MSTMRRALRVLVAVTVPALMLALLYRQQSPSTPSAPTAPLAVAAQPVQQAAASIRSRPSAAATQNPKIDCGGAQVLITDQAGSLLRECVASASAVQNGVQRTYRYTSTNNSGWSLSVVTEAGEIARVEAGRGVPDYFCEEKNCRGIAISRADALGNQILRFSDTVLRSADHADDSSAADSWTLDATLTSTTPVSPCADGVTLNFSDNTYTTFCALGGNGFSLEDDGSWLFTFRDLNGGTVTVLTDENSTVKRVEIENEQLSCFASACLGTNVSPPNERGMRTVLFLGVSLRSETGDRAVVLNGVLNLRTD